MKKTGSVVVLLSLVVVACAPRTVEQTAVMTTPAGSQFALPDLLPAGTMLAIELDRTVGMPENSAQRYFTAHVLNPVLSMNGEVVIPVGTVIDGTVTGFVEATTDHPSLIRLNFDRLTYEGLSFPLIARVDAVGLVGDQGERMPIIARNAMLNSAEARMPGTIVAHADLEASRTDLGPEPGTVISLGTQTAAVLPMGARLEIEVLQDVPLHSNPS